MKHPWRIRSLARTGQGKTRVGGIGLALAALVIGSCRAGPARKGEPADPVAAAFPAKALAWRQGVSVHAPVREGRCAVCHVSPADPKKLTAPVETLCLTCHESRAKDLKKAHVHAPFAAGDCTVCHDPHGTDHPHQLADEVNAVCTTCHQPEDDTIRKAHNGIIVAKLECTECHTPHGSESEHLIHEDGTHPPFAGGTCDACHDEPGKDGALKLKGTGVDICLPCHGDAEGWLARKNAHRPAQEGTCWACHSPHASQRPKLIRGDTATVCRSCHAKVPPVGHPVGKHPTSLARKDPRDADRTFSCASCHEPHGSEHAKLTFEEGVTMCMACHPK